MWIVYQALPKLLLFSLHKKLMGRGSVFVIHAPKEMGGLNNKTAGGREGLLVVYSAVQLQESVVASSCVVP